MGGKAGTGRERAAEAAIKSGYGGRRGERTRDVTEPGPGRLSAGDLVRRRGENGTDGAVLRFKRGTDGAVLAAVQWRHGTQTYERVEELERAPKTDATSEPSGLQEGDRVVHVDRPARGVGTVIATRGAGWPGQVRVRWESRVGPTWTPARELRWAEDARAMPDPPPKAGDWVQHETSRAISFGQVEDVDAVGERALVRWSSESAGRLGVDRTWVPWHTLRPWVGLVHEDPPPGARARGMVIHSTCAHGTTQRFQVPVQAYPFGIPLGFGPDAVPLEFCVDCRTLLVPEALARAGRRAADEGRKLSTLDLDRAAREDERGGCGG